MPRKVQEKERRGAKGGKGGEKEFPNSRRFQFCFAVHALPSLELSCKRLTYDLRLNPPLWLDLAQVYFYYLQQKCSNLGE